MSKKIYLRRKDLDGHLPKAVRAEATMKLSSVYVNRQPLKGFDPADEKKHLNGILDVTPDHVDWPKHSKRFWADMTIPVGFTGVEFEIGLDDDGSPLNVMDYIKYNFALRHPHVALTKEEMESDFNKRFFIQDLSREDKVKNNEIQLKKDADKEFIKLSSNVKNMKRVLRLLSNTNPDRMTEEQIENSLYEIKNSNPKKFVRVATDKHLELKAEIEWLERQQVVGPSTPVIIGKHGTSGVLDGPEVQKEVTSADIQAIPGNSAIAFTLVHQ